MKVCFTAHVKGRVQGVYFRASAQQQAIDLGISGYARNLADGEVEVLACGERESVSQFIKWLEHGPDQASVDGVVVRETPWQDQNHFSIG